MGMIRNYFHNKKVDNVYSSFSKYLKAPQKNTINIYKYTDFVQKLDNNLFNITNHKYLVKYVTLIYYYQLILICRSQEPNRKIKNFLEFPAIIKYFVQINNNNISNIKMGLFEFKYDKMHYTFLDNYDTIIKIVQHNIMFNSSVNHLSVYYFKSQENIYSSEPRPVSIHLYEPVKSRIYESIHDDEVYVNVFL